MGKKVEFVNESGFPLEATVKEKDGKFFIIIRKCRLSKYMTDCEKCDKCKVGME